MNVPASPIDRISVCGEITVRNAPGAAVTVAAASTSSARVRKVWDIHVHMVAVPAEDTVTWETDSKMVASAPGEIIAIPVLRTSR